MLYSVESQAEIVEIPQRSDFDRWCARLPQPQYESVIREINRRVDGPEIQASNWIPSNGWHGTPFQPIYDACNEDERAAARFLALLVWVTLMHHPDYWSFKRQEANGVPIEELTYVRVEPPARRPHP